MNVIYLWGGTLLSVWERLRGRLIAFDSVWKRLRGRLGAFEGRLIAFEEAFDSVWERLRGRLIAFEELLIERLAALDRKPQSV